MFFRRLRTVIAVSVAVAVLAGGATVAWSSAHELEKATCSLDVPARVSIDRPYLTPPVRRGADCAAAGVQEASWTAYTPTGAVGSRLYFNWDFPAEWSVFAPTERGTWIWRPAGAETDLQTDRPLVPQNTPVTDLRLGSTAGLTGHRDDRRITLTGTIRRFNPATYTAEPWPNALGELQLREPGDRIWSTFKQVTTNSRGEATEAFDLAARYDFRLVVPDTADTWGSASPTIPRV
ncbi:hypothetical protein [Kribbella endophytica]